MDPVSRAQNSEITKGRPFEKGNRHRFLPGQSGNPGGRPKKNTFTALYERILRQTRNRKAIEQQLMNILLGKSAMAAVLLAREIAERTEGKVAQEIQVDGNLTLSLADTIANRRKQLDDSDE